MPTRPEILRKGGEYYPTQSWGDARQIFEWCKVSDKKKCVLGHTFNNHICYSYLNMKKHQEIKYNFFLNSVIIYLMLIYGANKTICNRIFEQVGYSALIYLLSITLHSFSTETILTAISCRTSWTSCPCLVHHRVQKVPSLGIVTHHQVVIIQGCWGVL